MRIHVKGPIVFAAGWLSLALWGAINAGEVAFVERPGLGPPNRFYIANRAPLKPSPLVKLPIGAIRPAGWLRQQLELQADGFHGHLTDISPFLRKENNAWLSASGVGASGWEEVPYWLKGFGDCAYLLGRTPQIEEARTWIEAALASQAPDGFFGPRPGVTSTVESTRGKYDLWPNMVMLFCLQSWHEFTGDVRVLDLMTRYFQWQLEVPEAEFLPPFWQQQRAADNLFSVYWLYNRTGQAWLLELATKIHRHTADWTGGIPNWHNVNMAQAFGGPTTYWMQSGDPQHLQASYRNWLTIRESYGPVPGGMFGGDENCRPGYFDPRQAVETCGMVEMMLSHETLLIITGDWLWADRCEDVAFNSLPAALTSDLKGLRYVTAPNLIRSDRGNKAPGYQNSGPMLHFDPHNHRCCQHNFGHGWPYFAEHQWLATPGNGLAAVFYGANEVQARVGDGELVRIVQQTRYPFDERINLRIDLARPTAFPLYLRVPGWCRAPEVRLNGKRHRFTCQMPGYLRIDRTWRDQDRIELSLPMEISLRTWTANHHSVSVDRGPLTYSLAIEEQTVRLGGTDRWPAWEILPASPWNYGLVLGRRPEASFTVIRKTWPDNDQPFTHDGCPIELIGRAHRIPEWREDPLGLVGLLQPSPARSTEPVERIRLIPMGAARLRITAFPVIGRGTDAHAWSTGPGLLPYRASASHCYAGDTLTALHDEWVPANSNDPSIPRFTWWDRRGTTEWVQYEFEHPRKLNGVEVYWFDDTPSGGCALPVEWRVLHRVGQEWREVSNARKQPVAKDGFNRMAFDSISTQDLRLEVQFAPERSAGILEWRVLEP